MAIDVGSKRSGKTRAPTGQLALVFTDVQGSTYLWEQATHVMRLALDLHNDVLRRHVKERGGYEVKTEGDAFMLAFEDTGVALNWALDVQKALLEAPWPEALGELKHAKKQAVNGRVMWHGLRVRIGIHTGRPEWRRDEVTGRTDYFGPMVNRAARVAGAGHGGQVVISGAAWEAVSEKLDACGRPSVIDLGEHWFKGLSSAERLYQVMPAELLNRRFAPIKSIAPPGDEPTDHSIPVGLVDGAASFSAGGTGQMAMPDAADLQGNLKTGIDDLEIDATDFSMASVSRQSLRRSPAKTPPGLATGANTKKRGGFVRGVFRLSLLSLFGLGGFVGWQYYQGIDSLVWAKAQLGRFEQATEGVSVLNITSEPSGAQVILGREVLGTTPVATIKRLPKGSVRLLVSLEGYQTYSANLNGEPTHRIEVKLKPQKSRQK